MQVSIGNYTEDGTERKVEIEVHPWDTWGMDQTLSLIIVPMLKQLKESKHGAPYVNDEDVPEELRSTSAKPKENDWDTDEFHFKRWDYVIEEMQWGFQQIAEGGNEGQFYDHSVDFTDAYRRFAKLKVNHEGLQEHQGRIRNATRLFGVYFQNLWD